VGQDIGDECRPYLVVRLDQAYVDSMGQCVHARCKLTMQQAALLSKALCLCHAPAIILLAKQQL
jgi:hypothetical protein